MIAGRCEHLLKQFASPLPFWHPCSTTPSTRCCGCAFSAHLGTRSASSQCPGSTLPRSQSTIIAPLLAWITFTEHQMMQEWLVLVPGRRSFAVCLSHGACKLGSAAGHVPPRQETLSGQAAVQRPSSCAALQRGSHRHLRYRCDSAPPL